MALHTQLPIYKVTYDLLALITKLTASMPRDFKRSLGDDLRKECVTLSILVYRANAARNKVPHLVELLEHLQVVELTLRLSVDMRLISHGQYAAAIELTDKVGKQAQGWRKHAAASPAA
ncbi:four helix bundle protein [Chromobacterium haemolyticum]|uniref:Four helix bundle protein n=1 Tax=Chromobacterium fluminis TaxID=3044269 RepID=A0ABX0L963_9NEIS|nr:four helix bundle protein [Chromobacterium haemolyticum]NHR08379.1 four helix bundle protein [Chromobacterium haemolyticum]